ncbi:MAG: putative PEP-binding protein [Sneathiellaceae bacterium]
MGAATTAAGPLTLCGLGVSEGIAVAPLFRLAAPDATVPAPAAPPGDRAAERTALDRAVAEAQAALERLIAALDDDAAGAMLEFQAALLEDEDLLQPVHDAIGQGLAAGAAWERALNLEIAAYRDGGDELFAARASDLEDLRGRVLAALAGDGGAPALPAVPSILLGADLPPSRLLEIDRALIAGIALGEGSRTSHVALLAKARGLPLVVGLGELPAGAGCGDATQAILDGGAGLLVLAPAAADLLRAAEAAGAAAREAAGHAVLAAQPARTADGEAVRVMLNVDDPAILDSLPVGQCDGIGLTRTEFLFRDGAPDEARQLAVYAGLLRWAQGRPVTIRTLDAGGDKPMPGLTIDGEGNPFLGVRGVRLSLRRRALFVTQLRALLRAAAEGPLKIMLPMVTVPEELAEVRGLLAEAAAALSAAGLPHAMPALGIMIEVPAAALSAEDFDAAFYSIGSNDLIQYATACARDNAALAGLARGDHPGVLRMIAAVVAAGRARGVEVGVCGDMASSPAEIGHLLAAGVRSLSVAPAAVGRVKAAIAGWQAPGRGG